MITFNSNRKWILLFLISIYAIISLITNYHYYLNLDFLLFIEKFIFIFFPWGNNFYTLNFLILFLALDILIDFLSAKFDTFKFSLHLILRSVFALTALIHLLLIGVFLYFMQKGGF
jgi:hypothetical protein